MGLSRGIVRVTLSTRTAGPDDYTAIPGMTLWIVSWTARERVGRERVWTAPHVTETGARRMVRNLLRELAPGLDAAEVYSEELGWGTPT